MARPIARLKRRAEFLRVAQDSRKWVTPGLILQASPTAMGRGGASRGAEGGIRVGFTASRKVGKAVARNRVRRRLRAVAEQVMPLQAKGDYDYVVIGRRQTLTRPFHALVEDLETALRRLGAYRDSTEAGKRESRSERR